ncbi:glucose-6-phosphate dehydrogenase [Rhizobium rhizosphaerae]|uniref:Glucose-6-phosphate 1-dehydrogenase n=1 Tax=Xaviernesmea rhizosphaerae TaxID=1672749 RepID=A0A1Q9AD44_9HYPH|nr:glucose-6-phosphate dehydrogenase [Xaviernesmea rhizosphaerae]OLP52831.1 glucose-6-phosphate dehydrogenase [Xaviernesmea rhizosphaerae]
MTDAHSDTMADAHSHTPHSDALVLFGATGDLAHKKIFPSLYQMVARGHLDVPVIGIAFDDWPLEKLVARARDGIAHALGEVDETVFGRLVALLSYVSGDYRDAATFDRLKAALGARHRPIFYLAIPPSLFETVVRSLQQAGLTKDARLMIEKPFGHDLASARDLNAILHSAFPESALFRIDHYLGKEAIQNLLYFRFANSFLEPVWNRDHIDSVEITMAEDFSVEGRGKFYDEVGCLRDVVQNHLLNVLLLLAMEPPAGHAADDLMDEKQRVLKAMPALSPPDIVRGQFRGYLDEPGVKPGSTVETFVAVRFRVDTWRWQGVPFYIRAGKNLPVHATEVVVRFKRPPIDVFDPLAGAGNYVRFRIAPQVVVALGARRKMAGDAMIGEPVELLAVDDDSADMLPYERLIGDAIAGNKQLFTRQDISEEAWRVVAPVLDDPIPPPVYAPGTWGPEEAMTDFGPPGGWHALEAAPKGAPATSMSPTHPVKS